MTLDLHAVWTGNDLPGQVTLDGSTFDRNGCLECATSMSIQFDGSVVLPPLSSSATITAPVTFTGTFYHPPDVATLSGNGIATLSLEAYAAFPGNWRLRRVLYTLGSLPVGWISADVGMVGQAGSASFSNGEFSVSGAGADVWGSADSFHFASRGSGGDTNLVTRVTAEQFTSVFAKAGLMIRQSYDVASPHVILDVKPDGGIEFMTRPAAGAATTFLAGRQMSFPVWLKLTRSGSTVSASVSSDGTSWSPVGATTLSSDWTPFALQGLAVTSHDTSALNTAMFDHTSLTGSGGSTEMSTPFGGVPAAIPGTIEAENFDDGGEAVAYHDNTPGNSGSQYRDTDVDVESATEHGFDIGWTEASEWLKYSVNAVSAGTYTFDLRVASLGQGGTFHVEFGGVNKTGTLTIPDTGGWQNWTTLTTTVSLSAGTQIMRVVVDSNGASGAAGNFNWFGFTSGTGSGGTAADVVIHASDILASALHGSWTTAGDATAANGTAIATPDKGVSHTNAALANPIDYVDVPFIAAADTPYRFWMRLKALNNTKFNDSIWVQFSDASTGYGIGTTDALLVNLAMDGSAATLNNWGWQNTAYWLNQKTTMTFPTSGTHTLRVQVREDGVEFDQIVLSPTTYLNAAPGPVTNDNTVLPQSP